MGSEHKDHSSKQARHRNNTVTLCWWQRHAINFKWQLYSMCLHSTKENFRFNSGLRLTLLSLKENPSKQVSRYVIIFFLERRKQRLKQSSKLPRATQIVANLGFESRLPDSNIHYFKYYIILLYIQRLFNYLQVSYLKIM